MRKTSRTSAPTGCRAPPNEAVFAAMIGDETIEVFDLRVPRGPAALRLALEEATSAVVGGDLETLVWPPGID